MSSQMQQHQLQIAVAAGAATLLAVGMLVMYRWRRRAKAKKPEPHGVAPPPLELDEVDVVLPPQARNILPQVVVEDANDTEDEDETQEAPEAEADAVEAEADAGEAEAEAEAGDADKAAQEEIERELESVLRRGKAAFRAQKWDFAAAQYTEAIALLDRLPEDASRRASLYNNRAAMHEKAGRLGPSLEDCKEALALQPGHKLARSRKSRIYVQMGRLDDAIAELCAAMYCERERVREAVAAGREDVVPEMPESFDAVVRQKAQQDADEAMAAKKARPPRMPPGRYTTYEVLTSFNSYTDLERQYGETSLAAATEAVAAAAAAVDAACDAAAAAGSGSSSSGGESSSSDGDAAVESWVRALHSRGMKYLLARDYGKAIVDLDCAAALTLAVPSGSASSPQPNGTDAGDPAGAPLTLVGVIIAAKEAQEAIAAGDEAVALGLAATAAVTALAALGAPAPLSMNGTPPAVAAAAGIQSAVGDAGLAAAVLAWSATFLHLRHDLPAATAMYERALALEQSMGSSHPDVWIKLASVRLDVADHEGAAGYLEKAIEADASYGTSYLYRAQMHMGIATAANASDPPEVMRVHEEQEAAREDIVKCLQFCPNLTQAYVRLVSLHLQSGEHQEARATLDDGIRRFPNSADLLTAKGEFVYGLAVAAQEADPMNPDVARQCMEEVGEALALFERAIAADPANPAPKVNKAVAIMQVHGDTTGCLELLEEAIRVDPNHQVAHLHMGHIKMLTSATVEAAEAAVGYFEAAMERSHEKGDVFEMAVMRATARGKVQGARLLGLTQLA